MNNISYNKVKNSLYEINVYIYIYNIILLLHDIYA